MKKITGTVYGADNDCGEIRIQIPDGQVHHFYTDLDIGGIELHDTVTVEYDDRGFARAVAKIAGQKKKR